MQVYLTLESESKREVQTLQSQLEAVKQVFASVHKQALASGGVVRCEAVKTNQVRQMACLAAAAADMVQICMYKPVI